VSHAVAHYTTIQDKMKLTEHDKTQTATEFDMRCGTSSRWQQG